MELQDTTPPPFWRSPAVAALAVAVLVGGFLLTTEHRAHVLGALPFLLFLACPLMHYFMHGKHRHRGSTPAHVPLGDRDA
jgi:hypothetical protein